MPATSGPFGRQGRPAAHFATFPDELPQRCILDGTNEKGVCGECGAPWERVVENKSELVQDRQSWKDNTDGQDNDRRGTCRPHFETLGWQPTCDHNAAVAPASVLDPFVCSGTSVSVAQSLGSRGVGLDLNPEYLDGAIKRIAKVTLPMTLV